MIKVSSEIFKDLKDRRGFSTSKKTVRHLVLHLERTGDTSEAHILRVIAGIPSVSDNFEK